MTYEKLVYREREPQQLSVRRLTPDDYQDFNVVAQSAWPGIKMFSEPIYVALTDHGASVAALEGEVMLGVSLNFLKPAAGPGEYSLYVHMLGTKQNHQGKGIGRKVMLENYRLVESGELGAAVVEVKLTSDPLEAKNVMFYLHHMGMSVQEYKLDAYKSLSTTGAQQHVGLPADRFVYTAQPDSAWVKERRLPSWQEYLAYLQQSPDSVLTFETFLQGELSFDTATSPVVLLEMPENIDELKEQDLETALQWRAFHQTAFAQLLSEFNQYAAVDATILPLSNGKKHFIVFMRDFDPNNPTCLQQSVHED